MARYGFPAASPPLGPEDGGTDDAWPLLDTLDGDRFFDLPDYGWDDDE